MALEKNGPRRVICSSVSQYRSLTISLLAESMNQIRPLKSMGPAPWVESGLHYVSH
jgi:hypothetical protein